MSTTTSGAQSSRESRTTSTIDRALNAVTSVLDSGGEGSLRLVDISKQSGVSIGSLYHHFGSRNGLIAAARERQFREGLSYPGQIEAKTYLAAKTPADFVRVFDDMLRSSEAPEVAEGRRHRFELIGSAASRPRDLPGVIALESAYLSAGEEIGRALYDRGWLKDGVEPRTFALFLHSLSMARVVRDLDDIISADAWRMIARRALEGVLVLNAGATTASSAEQAPA
jgi:AcrR family transcriptional regulator